jgi:hypothetical protein
MDRRGQRRLSVKGHDVAISQSRCSARPNSIGGTSAAYLLPCRRVRRFSGRRRRLARRSVGQMFLVTGPGDVGLVGCREWYREISTRESLRVKSSIRRPRSWGRRQRKKRNSALGGMRKGLKGRWTCAAVLMYGNTGTAAQSPQR